MGISVFPIETVVRTTGSRTCDEFSFRAESPHGLSWVFRYQTDMRGIRSWHLYAGERGTDLPADDPGMRDSLGTLSPGFTDIDIDTLLRRVSENPSVKIFTLLPGHIDAIDRPDFILVTLDKMSVATMRIFMSISVRMLGAGIVSSMSQTPLDALLFRLDGAKKTDFFSNPESELGRIRTSFDRTGFFMYPPGSSDDPMTVLPEFIRLAVARRKSVDKAPLFFRMDGDLRSGGALVDSHGIPVGIVRNAEMLFAGYVRNVEQQQRLAQAEMSRGETMSGNEFGREPARRFG